MALDPLMLGSVALAGSSAAMLVISGIRLRKSKHVNAPLIILPSLHDVQSLDTAAARIVHEIIPSIPGQAFHAYWLSDDGSTLRLRSSVARPSDPLVAPNYSGLVNDDTPLVPLSIPVRERPTDVRITGGKDVRWLEVPLGDHLLVRVQLAPRTQLPQPLLKRLTEASRLYAPLTLAIHEWFRAREATERADSLIDSAQIAMDTTLRPEKAIELLLRVGGHVVESRVQYAIVAGASAPQVLSDSSLGQELGQRIVRGDAPQLLSTPLDPDVVPGDRLGTLGRTYNACVRVPVLIGAEIVGCLFYMTEHVPSLDTYQVSVLQTLADRIAQLVASQQQMQAASLGYVDTLRAVVEAFDGLSPYSVGHSDRLARYSRLTALEMGLSPDEADAIALAAYFHDVGMVAVDPRIVLKPGRITADEMEKIRVHAELGAKLVIPVSAALPVDAMVAAHHERWDGHGYPHGLREQEIPIGARIIATIDLFEAKTSGRSYRAPRPFHLALEDLRAAGGGGLDPTVVEAFIRAWERMQQGSAPGVPQFRCWELKQLPDHVCAGCPNRSATPVRCWENKAHLCSRHGDECEGCFVYTEAMSRGLITAHRS